MMLKIERLTDSNKHQFATLWLPWLKQTMGLMPQPEDLVAMEDPIAFYGASGGAAFLATWQDKAVGTVAVKGLGAAGFEFCKLVVSEDARGKGTGKALIETCITYAEAQQGPDLWLQSFHKLDVALKLYERLGFEHAAPPQQMDVLDRTEVIMRMRVV